MKMRTAFIACALGVATAALAEEHARRVDLLPAYRSECASCHVAYPPGLLPAASWQRVMGSLKNHFGTDASLDETQVRQIGAWLASNAATGRRADAPPQDRITQSAWFQREHRDIAPAIWQRPAIRSAANCAACHTRADQGDFNEHAIRIPR